MIFWRPSKLDYKRFLEFLALFLANFIEQKKNYAEFFTKFLNSLRFFWSGICTHFLPWKWLNFFIEKFIFKNITKKTDF